MKSNKHIVWLCPGFAADSDDDSCIPPMQLFLSQLEKNYSDITISVIAFQYPYKTEPYEWGGTTVFPMNGKNKTGVESLLTWKKVWNTFKKIHKEKPVLIIHSFWFSECMPVGNFLSYQFKIPHLNTLMGQDVLRSNRYLKKYFLKHVPAVALCERHANTFIENTKFNPVAIIPWGIDEAKDTITATKEYDIIAVGSLIPLKRYDLFIRVIKELKITFPDIKVILAGDGMLKKILEEQTEQLNLSANITFAGNQKRSSVMDLMMKSKLFVHTSEYESFGFVFLEAMKCGLPIVSFPVGLAKESDNWKVVNSVTEMVNAITSLLQAGKTFSPSIPFPVKTTAENYIELYEKLSK